MYSVEAGLAMDDGVNRALANSSARGTRSNKSNNAFN